jgi:hypothetical protein
MSAESPPGAESRSGVPGQEDAANSAKIRKKTIRQSTIVKLARLRERYWRGDLSAKQEILRILRKAVS